MSHAPPRSATPDESAASQTSHIHVTPRVPADSDHSGLASQVPARHSPAMHSARVKPSPDQPLSLEMQQAQSSPAFVASVSGPASPAETSPLGAHSADLQQTSSAEGPPAVARNGSSAIGMSGSNIGMSGSAVGMSGTSAGSGASAASGSGAPRPRRRRIVINSAAANDPLSHGYAEIEEHHRGGDGSGKPFAANFIRTSKYRWWNFLFLNLIEQFRRIANLYFLIIIILQLIPDVSPFPIYTSIIPLVIILAVTAIKEAREDYNRHVADRNANARTYLVLRERADLCKELLHRAHSKGVKATERDVVQRLPRPEYAAEAGAAAIKRNGTGTAAGVAPEVQRVLVGGQQQHSVVDGSVGGAGTGTGSARGSRVAGGLGLVRMGSTLDSLVASRTNVSLSSVVVPAKERRKGTRESGVQWWQHVPSCDLRVGDIVRVLDGEEFPADLALLSTSSLDGLAFVNTANLDGEAVPKPKAAPAGTMEMVQPHGLIHIAGAITAEAPSSNMHDWKGALAIAAPTADEPPLPPAAVSSHLDSQGRYMHSLSNKQLLLRGSSLANTAYVNAVVVYTGPETRMMLNRNLARFKFSSFERRLNTFIIVIMLINLVCCLLMPSIAAASSNAWESWIDLVKGGFVGWLISFFTHYVLYSWMVPISLYVTIELIKIGQAQFMEWDNELKWKDPDEPPSFPIKTMRVNSSALNEELGAIDYVFSDKTGTLTQNKMELAYVSVAGTLFQDIPARLAAHGDSNSCAVAAETPAATATGAAPASSDVHPTVDALAQQIIQAIPFAFHGTELPGAQIDADEPVAVKCRPTRATAVPGSTGANPASWEALEPEERALLGVSNAEGFHTSRVREKQLLFAYNMLLNNGVQPVLDKETGKWQFQSQSPDEIALCESFYRAGIMLFRRLGDHLEVLCTTFDAENNPGARPTGVKKAPPGTAAEEDVGVLSSGVIPGTDGFSSYPGGLSTDVGAPSEAISSRGGAHTSETSAVVDVPQDAVASFTVLASLDFTSTRRRSDLVVRCNATGVTYLLIKGADSTVLPMCDDATADGKAILARTNDQAAAFAATGSRTLVLAGRVMGGVETSEWLATYSAANTSLNDREAALDAAFAQLERGLDLLGISAVNDQMQERVPETVDALLVAGIKVVVLTGDKRETAETISTECHILKPEMTKLYVSCTPAPQEVAERLKAHIASLDPAARAASGANDHLPAEEEAELRGEACRRSLAACLARVKELTGPNGVEAARRECRLSSRPSDAQDHGEMLAWARAQAAGKPSVEGEAGIEMVPLDRDDKYASSDASEPAADAPVFVAILSGNTLETALLHCKDDFMRLFLSCATIVTYRSAPKQKALVVQLVKQELGHTCLAIGDGANDVSMIQEAHVGIGILGKEGSHAAMSSDYVLHRFAHLERLLFIHGRYNLNRTSKVIMLSLWKNFVFVLPVVWFAFSDLYSGQVMASSYFMSLYNLLFTSLQPLVLGIFDRDVDEVLLKRTPLAYRRSKEESRYTIPELLRWILCAAAQSAIVYSFVFYGIMKPELRSGDGKTFDLQASGNTLCWAVIVLVNCVMLAECDLISWINIVAWGLGILFFILAYMVLSLIYLESLSPETYGLLQFSYNDTLLWLVFLLTVLAMWAIWGAWKAFTRLVTPFYFQKLQAWELELPIITERKALPTWIARALFAGDLTAAKRDDGDEAAQAPSKSVLAAK